MPQRVIERARSKTVFECFIYGKIPYSLRDIGENFRKRERETGRPLLSLIILKHACSRENQ
jgi:hypothetical protein